MSNVHCFLVLVLSLGLGACAGTEPVVAADPAPEPQPAAARTFSQGFVIELAPQQDADDIRAAAAQVFNQVVSVEALFPDVPADDDPFGLRRIYRLRVADPAGDESAWDLAYRLRDRGGFLQVEPDTDDTILEARRRSAAAACVAPPLDCTTSPQPRACKADWSLKEMKVDQARKLVPPAGGKALGEGVRICHPDSGWTDHIDLDAAQIDKTASLNLMEGGTNARDPLGYQGNPGHGTATGSVLISHGGFASNGGTTPPGVVTGLAPKATLVPIRALNSVVQILDSDIARAVRHATTAQCDVISMSLGGRLFFGLERAINDAVRRDIIVVTASGNCVGFVVAPASYDKAIAVAATNVDHKPWKGSSNGRAIDISAPGEDVHVARAAANGTGTNVEPGDGTSFATTAVAGAAADWIAFHGRAAIKTAQGSLTRRDLFVRLAQATADPPPNWDARNYGPGILDLEALLTEPLGTPRTELQAPPRDDTVMLLSRMFDRDPAELRVGLNRLFGQPADLDAELQRYGGELLELAARDPEAFLLSLQPPAPGALAPPSQPLKARSSRALSARLEAAP
ncbi:S8 family peptidase [Lysobacter niastensis]|uniref:S8/S53 family peptidase n=1 Tax=Lysobacter niastensis TaxID=380629 RepID=A0ABS0B5G5_9GAMM|nr:S8/S53 family peptidase [Lysobacter niastensis]MBF6024099.1 S8/S53 family peptidase [Lysobacter niastensis]